MISGIFHTGSGLGNQLARLIAVRCLALDKGYEWGMENPQNFKGSFFRNLDLGKLPEGLTKEFIEERIDNPQGVDIRPYDSKFELIEDGTRIDGEFQDPKYFMHHLDEIREWLEVDPMSPPYNECVIGFRGGEYQHFPDLFLTIDYWNNAIRNMQKIDQYMKFRVVTDDPELAALFFPHFHISHEISQDWRSIRYARYLIIANSSFYILPALLNEKVNKIIAPLHWARHNIGFWALPQNQYKQFTYQDRTGDLHNL